MPTANSSQGDWNMTSGTGTGKIALITKLTGCLLLFGTLSLLAAAAQQEQPKSDKTSARGQTGQNLDQASQQAEQQRRAREEAARQQQPQRRDQPTQPSRQDQTRDQQSRDQQARDQQARDQQARDQRGQADLSSANQREPRREQAERASFRQRLGLNFGQQQGRGQSGLTIQDVQQGTLAARAGFRAGDQIVSIDGRNVTGPSQLFAYLSGQYGRRVPVVISRGGQQYTIQLTPEQSGDVAWLGVYLQDSSDNQNQSGAAITQIYPAGPAARAGLRTGDLITAVDAQQVQGASELIGVIEEQEPGSRVEIAVSRNNQQVKLPVVLGSRDSFVYRGQGYGGQEDDQWSDQSGGQYARGRSGDGEYGENDHFSNLPPFAMQLEHERRMYEQNQRIETEIAKLQDEVRQLREAVQQLRR
jgi:C-terminal processing protease CtpA/Prc